MIGFAIGTVPDGCEIYLAANRDPAPVTRVGAGRVTLRWQVAGRKASDAEGAGDSIVRIHPIAADAETLLEVPAVRRIRAAFEAADCTFQIEATSSGRELIAQASRA